MAASCDCNVTLSNTGTPGCMPIQDVAKRLILVPMVDSSNNPNRLIVATDYDNTLIEAFINEADDKKRFYPLPEMENVTNERGDPISEDFPSGKNVKIRDGVKTFSGQMLSLSGDYAKQIEGFGCSNMGAYIVDAQGNLIGDGSDPLYLYPLSIDQETWDVRTMDTTDTTIAKIQLGFQWSISVKDSDVRMLLSSDFATDVDWLSYNGLVDISGVASAVSGTGFTMKITNGFGSLKSSGAVTGLTSFVVIDKALPGTPLSPVITESNTVPGSYEFLVPLTSASFYQCSLGATVIGFDDSKLEAAAITFI
jgi:hypothetical protein